MKRGISLLLALTTLVSMFAFLSTSVSAATSGYYSYGVLSNGTVQITKYSGDAENLELPSSIGGRDVTAIGNSTFLNCTTVSKVIVPSTVKSIADGTFRVACISTILVDGTNPYFASTNGALYNKDKTVLISCPYANTDCSLGLSDATQVISENAFWNCSKLEKIIIPENVKSIGAYAFYKCTSLADIEFASGTTSIGRNAFMNTAWLDSKPNGLVYANNVAYGYKGAIASDLIFKDGTIAITDYGFKDCPLLTSVEIPSTVVNIGSYSFMSCTALKSFTFTENIKSIGENAFKDCTQLENITIPSTVTGIGSGAFSGCCKIDDIKVSADNLNFVSDNGVLFNSEKTRLLSYPIGKQGNSYSIPNTVKSVDNYAFLDCISLQSVSVPMSVTSVGAESFYALNSSFVIYCNANSPARYVAEASGYHWYCCSNMKLYSAVTKATLSNNGKTDVKCSSCGQTYSTSPILKIGSVSLSTTTYTYNGNVKRPSVTVKNSSGTTLKNGTDYKVAYQNSSSKSVGKYKVVVTFIGKYSGSKTLYYKISPPKISISSLTAKDNAFVVKWSKKSGITGYQVQYSTKSSFSSYKTISVGSKSSVKKTVKSLKSKKKYYVRIRTYKKVGTTTFHGAWSTKKSIKTK